MAEIKRITFDEYAANPAINNSFLGDVRRSPALAVYRRDNPTDTEAMARGRALHSMVLEPGQFIASYIEAPECDRRTKEGKAVWAQFEANAAGRTILKASDAEQIASMAAAIDRHPAAASIISLIEATELSLFWDDPIIGIPCKARVDALAKVGEQVLAVDIKTTRDASREEFARSCWTYGYHRQAAFYLDGLAACGRPAMGWVLIVVESDPPHQVAVYRLDEASIDAGRAEIRRLLGVVAECMRTGQWPGYPDQVVDLSLPVWALARAESSTRNMSPDAIRF